LAKSFPLENERRCDMLNRNIWKQLRKPPRGGFPMPTTASLIDMTTGSIRKGKRNPRFDESALDRHFTVILYGLLFILCTVSYHGITDNYLFNDDFSWLREARYEMKPGNLVTHRVVNFFRPLINLSFYLMERTSPGNIRLHYSFNLVFHFLNSILVFHLISILLGDRWTAAAAAALFAVTSVHTGAVLWISARTTLMSTFLLMSSLTLLARGVKAGAKNIIWPIVLFVLALAAKETAIAGFPLLLIILWYVNKESPQRRSILRPSLSFLVVSAAYLVIRKSIMGGFTESNWGFGLHALRNVAGGFIYQLYPWPFFSLFFPSLSHIDEPAHPFLPEIAVIPLVILLVWMGMRTKRPHGVTFAALWTLLALLPAAPFRYRFFSTASITQNRYYYLSSVGSVLLITLLLGMLWRSRSRLRIAACTAVFAILCVGYMVRIHNIEIKWDGFTGMYRDVVGALVEESDRNAGFSTIAVENPPLAFPFIADAIALERPALRVIDLHDGKDEAERYKPCLYVSYSGDRLRAMRIEKIE
jgi:hypothetical protein